MKFDAGQFDVFGSTADDLALLRGEPLPGALGLQAAPQLNSDAGVLPGIHLNGINISIDEDLLIDAPGGQWPLKTARYRSVLKKESAAPSR